MDPIFKFPASPGTPLFPVSPERANRQHLPQSPSLPHISGLQNDPFIAHSRGNSDVQGKVAQFNNLSKEAAQRRKDNEAALKRAVLGREEAESETRRLKEENRTLRLEIEEGRARERRVGERMEGFIEESQRSKEQQAHSQSIYEKEVRRARKEAFKSSSALVKMQEELKSARNKYTLMREEVDVQRRKVEAKDQEAFGVQHAMVDLQEELDRYRHQIKVTEGQRDALKMALKAEEVSRIAAEGAINLPVSPEEEDEFASPRKRSRKHERESSIKENVDPQAPTMDEDLLATKEALRVEKRLRLRADDQVHFLKMECQFQCCSCRVAERQGVEYVHDDFLPNHLGDTVAKPVDDLMAIDGQDLEHAVESPPEPRQPQKPQQPEQQQREASEPLLNFSPSTGTFYKAPSPTKASSAEDLLDILSAAQQSEVHTQQSTASIPSTPEPSETALPTSPTFTPQLAPSTPSTPSITYPTTPRPLPNPPSFPRTISHTTTINIPLKDSTEPPTPVAPQTPIPPTPSAPLTPGGISRDEALEQIRLRRGRARSIAQGNGTPRRKGVDFEGEGLKIRRDISAPAAVAAGVVARR